MFLQRISNASFDGSNAYTFFAPDKAAYKEKTPILAPISITTLSALIFPYSLFKKTTKKVIISCGREENRIFVSPFNSIYSGEIS